MGNRPRSCAGEPHVGLGRGKDLLVRNDELRPAMPSIPPLGQRKAGETALSSPRPKVRSGKRQIGSRDHVVWADGCAPPPPPAPPSLSRWAARCPSTSHMSQDRPAARRAAALRQRAALATGRRKRHTRPKRTSASSDSSNEGISRQNFLALPLYTHSHVRSREKIGAKRRLWGAVAAQRDCPCDRPCAASAKAADGFPGTFSANFLTRIVLRVCALPPGA